MKILKRLLGCKSKKFRIEIFTGPSGKPCSRIVSNTNGQTLYTAQTYDSGMDNCAETALSVGTEAGFEVRFTGDSK